MTRKFSELEEKMLPESRERVDKAVQEALKELPLNELRNARGLSQKMLAAALGIQQPAIAKMEKRTEPDMTGVIQQAAKLLDDLRRL